GWALGVGVGFPLGCLLLGVDPAWPPKNDLQRLLLILWPAAVLVEVIAASRGLPRVVAWIGRLAVAAAAARILRHGTGFLREPFGPGTSEWTAGEARCWLAALAAALLAVWALMALLMRRSPGRSVPLALALTCAGTGAVVGYSGYATAGLSGLALGAALLG